MRARPPSSNSVVEVRIQADLKATNLGSDVGTGVDPSSSTDLVR